MKRLPRQAKSAAKPIVDVYSSEESDDSDKENQPPSDDFFKNVKKEDLGEESPDSDFEQQGRKRKNKDSNRAGPAKKTKLTIRKKGQASPEIPIPPMSDDEYEDDRIDDLKLFEKAKKTIQGNAIPGVRFSTLPQVLRIEVLNAPTTINLNLSDFLAQAVRRQVPDVDLDGNTLLENSTLETNTHMTTHRRAKSPESFIEIRANKKYACFLELEPELRNRIYRELLVKDTAVTFNPSPDLSRTATLLRTCRQVYQEATDILYGENAFHLDRTDQRRGTLYTTWREVGYKDMRRFLETIGQENLSKMRYLSICLQDATQYVTPELTQDQRRYYNDPVLCHIFRLIGNSDAVFEKLVVDFGGRGALDFENVAFIRAFTSMRCRKLIKTCHWHHSRISSTLFEQMKEFMKVPISENINPDKQKAPKMQHEMVTRSHGCTTYSCHNR